MRASSQPQPRSAEMVFAGYYLSRLTRPDKSPPLSLGVRSWNEAYDLFYDSCADGRSPSAFRNSLKNARDSFDSHLENPRRGWFDDSAAPMPLGTLSARVLEAWSQRADSELEEAIRDLLDRSEWVSPQAASGQLKAGNVLQSSLGDPSLGSPGDMPTVSPRRARDAKRIGDLAEKHVMDHLSHVLSANEVETLVHHAAIGETPGYDVSYMRGEELVAIEVKGTMSPSMTSFFISANEWRAAEDLGPRYNLYLVGDVESDEPVLEILNNPLQMDGHEIRRTPMVWSVSLRG